MRKNTTSEVSTEDTKKKPTKTRTLRKPSANKTSTKRNISKKVEVENKENSDSTEQTTNVTIANIENTAPTNVEVKEKKTSKKLNIKGKLQSTRKTKGTQKKQIKSTPQQAEDALQDENTISGGLVQDDNITSEAIIGIDSLLLVEEKEPEIKNIQANDNLDVIQNDNIVPPEPIADSVNEKDDTTTSKNERKQRNEQKVPALPKITINDIVELSQAPMRAIVLTDQQIQQLTLEDIEERHAFLQQTLANVLDYDVVISDTNIWLELLVGHTSSHSDPRYNARLQFERQLEFISKLTKYRGGRFMMMSETYEEIDRFACMQDPTNHREADFTDNVVYLNAAARLAKRLILSQQRENRLRIDNIGAESHHASFADPAIIHRVAELFAEGKKVLLLTNDASVAIRSIGICDDLQRHNNISDEEWNEKYAPLRPMVFTFDDLKLLDYYTRQYHYIQMAAGQAWMGNIDLTTKREPVAPLALWDEAFRPGDKHRNDNLFTEQEQKQILQKQQQNTKVTTRKQTQQPKTDVKNDTVNEQMVVEQVKTEQKTAKTQQRKAPNRRKNSNRTTANTRKTTESNVVPTE